MRLKGEVGSSLDRSKLVLLWIFFYILCLSLSYCIVCVMQPCGHLLVKGLFFALLYVMFSRVLSLSYTVS